MNRYIKTIFLTLILGVFAVGVRGQVSPVHLPDSVYSGKQGKLHVQGVVVDHKNGYVYMSFTHKLLKMDLSGKLIGSLTGFLGHLGDLDFNEEDGKIYGSLEYKNDAIGQGIRNALGVKEGGSNGFYIAVIDGSKIVRPEMNAEEEKDIINTVFLPEVLKDYEAKVLVNGQEKAHRFACSGIDGVAFAPAIGGNKHGKKYLYVAYGVYGDNERDDNDYQVILRYDVSGWNKYASPLLQDNLHHSGPKKPLNKYFVKTGNTRYGIQNLAYDPFTGHLMAAVYKGSKPQYPNYDLFIIDGNKKPFKGKIKSDDKWLKVTQLSLADLGSKDEKTGIRGWHFKWGATGLCPLGDGYFYISHNGKSEDGQQQTTIYKYKWVGDAETPFVRVK